MNDEMIPLTQVDLTGSELKRIAAVLESGQLVQAGTVRQFESALEQRLAVSDAVACSSGTLAIQLSLRAMGVGPGDNVVMPDFCFPSVAAAVLSVGADCTLCDIAPHSFNAGLEQIESALTPRTKAVIAVHQFGVPAGAKKLVDSLSIPVLEDAACALGAVDDGEPCGKWGAVGCYSFHPRKIITTAEGGLMVTRRSDLADRLRMLRNHGMVYRDTGVEFEEVGMSGRMTEVHAAIGLAQLERLDAQIAGRAQAAGWYRQALASIDGVITDEETWAPGRVYQSLVVRIHPSHERDAVIQKLRGRGVHTTLGTYAIHRQSSFASLCRTSPAGLPESTRAYAESITLPLWSNMKESTVLRVAEALREVLH